MENSKMLIDPVPLEKQVQDCINQCYKLRIDSVGPLAMFLDYIKEAPLIEAKEVQHGQWIVNVEYNNGEKISATCSHCKVRGEVRTHRNEWGIWHIDSPYCPNCGAKMDGGR